MLYVTTASSPALPCKRYKLFIFLRTCPPKCWWNVGSLPHWLSFFSTKHIMERSSVQCLKSDYTSPSLPGSPLIFLWKSCQPNSSFALVPVLYKKIVKSSSPVRRLESLHPALRPVITHSVPQPLACGACNRRIIIGSGIFVFAVVLPKFYNMTTSFVGPVSSKIRFVVMIV